MDVSMEGIKKIYETDKEGMLEAMTMTCAELWTKVPQRRMHEKIMYAMNISIDLEAEDGLLKMIELVSVNVLTDVDEDDIEERAPISDLHFCSYSLSVTSVLMSVLGS